ncbi:MAG: hypothetical protein KFF77_07130 [Bacteroidetes bacterium]|nr:hypothetical protein [Bacteroidota bacterium]
MKRIALLLIIALSITMITVSASAQDGPPIPEGKHRERLEQLRRIKMIEALDLDEEQAVRLTVREKDFREKERGLLEQRKQVLQDLQSLVEKGADDNALRAQLGTLVEIGTHIVREKHTYILSLNDFLSMEQIAKMVLFEQKFTQEVRRLLEKSRHGSRR